MYKVIEKTQLNNTTYSMKVTAPRIAKKAMPGQFVIIRADEYSERIPLTIAEYDRQSGWVRIIYQTVGKSTMKLAQIPQGGEILDFTGPLGKPTELEGYKRVAVIGGGLGCAIAYPQAKYLHDMGVEVDIIAGFRTSELIIFEKEMSECSSELVLLTDDGSNGHKGLVTDGLRARIDSGANYDLVIAIGPVIMMKFVSLLTKEYGIKTYVSLNPIMIDGTGMCGGCRVAVGGQTKFACVDGPDFDAHEVDFDQLMTRLKVFGEQERASTAEHQCKMEQLYARKEWS